MDKETKRVFVQVLLFVITFITTTLAGSEWAFGRSIIYSENYSWNDFVSGMSFSVPMLMILTVHEFGHYFTALYHKIKTSLPYYIPIPPIPFFPLASLGTLGAVIRLRSKPDKNVQVFDVGLAGPLAGFVVAVALLVYGFATLPPAEYVYQFHPEYEQFGTNYAEHVYSREFHEGDTVIDVTVGKNLIFLIAEQFVDDPARIPNAHELMHYPLLLGVYFALFITSLNLLPVGQLDGGHVIYGLFGYKAHRIIATGVMLLLVFYGGLNNPWINFTIPPFRLLLHTIAYVAFLYFVLTGLRLPRQRTLMLSLVIVALQFLVMSLFPMAQGYLLWLIWALLIGRLIGVYHPPSEIEEPLNLARVILGWLTLIVFILCFSPAPLEAALLT
jgi:membrane-associated protease RseP (regulator of RpoE activity)